jgi:PAS domain S-box-containing protein
MYSVLYVDDDQLLLDVCRSYLERNDDFRIETTGSAPYAIEKIQTTSYDAIVSDYQMPEMDGITFLKEVRSRFGEIPFILFTGKGREEIVIEAINNGADFYLQKGGDARSQFAELAHKIRKAVERRKAIEDLRKNESRFKLLQVSVDRASDEVYWLDSEGTFLYVNDSACRNTGYSREEFLKMTLFDLDPEYTPEKLARSGMLLKERKTNVFTTRHRHKDGTLVDVEVMSNYVLRDGRDYYFAFSRDITRRKQAEDALRESEERFQVLAESSLDGILVTDLEGRALTANHACLAMFELGGLPDHHPLYVFEHLTPDSVDAARCDFFAMSPDKNGITRTYSAITARGRKLFVEVLGNRITYKGAPANILSIRDVTARHEMEERLRESELRFRTLSDGALEGIMIHDDGVIRDCNQRFAELFGYRPEEIIGRNGYEFMMTAESVARISAWKQQGAGGTIDITGTRKDGTLFSGETSCAPIVWQGKPQTIVQMRDITDRKRAEDALRESEERYRRLIAQSFDAVVIHQDGSVVFANEAAARLVKAKSPAEMVGRATLNFVDPAFSGIVGERIRTMMETPGAVVPLIEERFHCCDGTTVDVEVIATAAVHQGKPAVQVVARDISGRKRAEEALRAANRQLNLLTSITRHDIRNKVMVISGYLELVKQEPLDPKIQDLVGLLESTTRSIGEHIEATRIYQDLGSTEPRWQDLARVLPPRSLVPGGITLQSDVDGVEVCADPILEKIFSNLLDNTLRHGSHATTIRVYTRECPGGLDIFWEDNGIGIPVQEKEKIFQQGYGKNTGLGLFLAREILSITGITISETGEPGKGARFEMKVPHGAYRIPRERPGLMEGKT